MRAELSTYHPRRQAGVEVMQRDPTEDYKMTINGRNKGPGSMVQLSYSRPLNWRPLIAAACLAVMLLFLLKGRSSSDEPVAAASEKSGRAVPRKAAAKQQGRWPKVKVRI